MGTSSLNAQLDAAEAALTAKLVEAGMRQAPAAETAHTNRSRILLSEDGAIRIEGLKAYSRIQDPIAQLARELVAGAPTAQLFPQGLRGMTDEERRAAIESKRKSGVY